jgi:hypothetical protein
LKIKWTRHPVSTFADWATSWDAVNHTGSRLPFMDARFIAAALRHFAAPNSWLMVGSRHNEPIALGIFTRNRSGLWDTWQPSQLPLGAWLMKEGLGLPALAHSLLGALPGVSFGVGFSQQDPHLISRPTAGVTTLDYVATAGLTIAGRFEDYWATRGKNLRHNMKRQQAKLEAANTTPQLRCLTDPHDMREALKGYADLEAGSWKAQHGTAVGDDNAQGRFYGEVMHAMAHTGQARVYQYLFDRQVVAMDLCLTQGPTMVILKTACRDDLPGLSPAMLMHRDIFSTLFNDAAVSRVEFYGRVMEWHTRWTDDTRMLYHANFFRFPRLVTLARRAKQLLSRGQG